MGLAYVAPIGLQNLFVINTALTREKGRVFLTALIVIFFDVTLALACFYGIGAVMERSPLLEKLVLLAGSLIVMYIGVGLMRAKDSLKKTDVDMPLWRVASTACVVTWFNPQALIDGTMMLGAFHRRGPTPLYSVSPPPRRSGFSASPPRSRSSAPGSPTGPCG